jgi:hypothetical protein
VDRQLTTRPVQPGFHSSHRAIADLGNFGQAELLMMVQYEADAVLLPQNPQGQFEFFRQFVVARRGPVSHLVSQFRCQITIAAEGQGSPAAIDGDPQDPRLQRTLLIEPGQTSQGPDERFLRHILGILAMGQNPEGDAENQPLEPTNEFPDSQVVSRQTAFDQQGFTPLGTG